MVDTNQVMNILFTPWYSRLASVPSVFLSSSVCCNSVIDDKYKETGKVARNSEATVVLLAWS